MWGILYPTLNMEKHRRSRSIALVCAMLAGVFVLKLVVLSQLRNHPMTQPGSGLDTTAYVELAKKVLGGKLE